MTTEQKVARRKLSLLELASELSNVSRACKVMGYSRQQFYEIRRNFQTYGAEGLTDRLPGARGPHPNRVAAEIETAILDHALEHPCHGSTRVEQEMRLKGIAVSSGGVRGVWQRHGLLTKHERLLRLEKATAERKIELKEDQIRLLASPRSSASAISKPRTPEAWSPSIPSSSATSKAWAKSIFRPPSIAIRATPGQGSILPSSPSRLCT
jgi:hypothetical protein